MNNFNHPSTNIVTKLLVTVLEVIVIIIEKSLKKLNIKLVPTLTQPLVQKIVTTTSLIVILQIRI